MAGPDDTVIRNLRLGQLHTASMRGTIVPADISDQALNHRNAYRRRIALASVSNVDWDESQEPASSPSETDNCARAAI